MSIMDPNSVANLRKMMHYNSNIDLVNDNVYTNFDLNPSIPSQDIERKPNYDGMAENNRMTDRQGESS